MNIRVIAIFIMAVIILPVFIGLVNITPDELQADFIYVTEQSKSTEEVFTFQVNNRQNFKNLDYIIYRGETLDEEDYSYKVEGNDINVIIESGVTQADRELIVGYIYSIEGQEQASDLMGLIRPLFIISVVLFIATILWKGGRI